MAVEKLVHFELFMSAQKLQSLKLYIFCFHPSIIATYSLKKYKIPELSHMQKPGILNFF